MGVYKQFLWSALILLLLQTSIVNRSAAAPSGDEELEKVVSAAYESGGYGKAIELMLPKAKAGDPEMQFSVGYAELLWIEDKGAKKPSKYTMDDALYWIRLAAKRNVHQALSFLQSAYAAGLYTVPKNVQIASCFEGAVAGKRAAEECLAMDKR